MDLTASSKYRPRITYILLWTMLAIVHFAIVYTVYNIGFWPALTESLLFNSIFAFMGYGLWFMVRYTDLNKRSIREIAFSHLSGAALVLLIWLGLSYLLLNIIFSKNEAYQAFLDQTLTVRIVSGIFIYIALISFYYLILNFRELQEQKSREDELKSLLQESELSLLRSQIRPHFLFNSLNSISSLTITKPEKAQEMVIKLSDFMRYSLSHPEGEMSTLGKELQHIQLYLDIEKVRFGNRLHVVQNINPDILQAQIPSMILQPVIENAVKYGVYESLDKTEIHLEAFIKNDLLIIKVGNAYDQLGQLHKGTGTGLKNIRARLENIYKRFDLLSVKAENSCYEIEIKIPING